MQPKAPAESDFPEFAYRGNSWGAIVTDEGLAIHVSFPGLNGQRIVVCCPTTPEQFFETYEAIKKSMT